MQEPLIKAAFVLGLAAFALSSCGPPGVQTPEKTAAADGKSLGLPQHRAGLWRQAVSRDARPLPMANAMNICLGPDWDSHLATLGETSPGKGCKSQVSRAVGGAYQFSSICGLGHGGTVTSKGVAQGDFSTAFSLHLETDVTGADYGPINGRHVTDIESRYVGPCPAGMKPGDMALSNGLRLNADKVRRAAALLGGG